MFQVGLDAYECPDVAALNRELAAMSMSIPADLGAALQEEQRYHLAGSWGSQGR